MIKVEIEIKVTGLTEEQVISATENLQDEGFMYDEDFTTLYGAQWAVVGLQFANLKAAAFIINAIEKDVEACPGCGAKPGQGVSKDCNDVGGCGYWKAFEFFKQEA